MMTLWIKNRETAFHALRERLGHARWRSREVPLRVELRAIRGRCTAIPVFDARTPEEIVGYNGGVPN